jgi:hypothetical protein
MSVIPVRNKNINYSPIFFHLAYVNNKHTIINSDGRFCYVSGENDFPNTVRGHPVTSKEKK